MKVRLVGGHYNGQQYEIPESLDVLHVPVAMNNFAWNAEIPTDLMTVLDYQRTDEVRDGQRLYKYVTNVNPESLV